MDTLAQGGPEIEVVQGDKDFRKLAEDAAFMEEMIDIRFLSSGDQNAPKLIEGLAGTSSPDGKTGGKTTYMGFQRGTVYTVPRFMFEIFAHAKISTLRQVPDPRNPVEMLQVLEHAFAYPMECVRDPNPKGAAWREKVLADPC
jgi:hypothetical protein